MASHGATPRSVLPSPIHPDLSDGISLSSDDPLVGEGRSLPPLGTVSDASEGMRQHARSQSPPTHASRGRSDRVRPIATSSAPTLAAPRYTTAQWQQSQGQQHDTLLPASQQCSSGSANEKEEHKDKERPRQFELGSVGSSHAAGGELAGALCPGALACGQSLRPPVGRGGYGVREDAGEHALGHLARSKGGSRFTRDACGSKATDNSSTSQHISRTWALVASLPHEGPSVTPRPPALRQPSSSVDLIDLKICGRFFHACGR